jgi:protein involved in polysaccharide export with SLBB domain
MKLSKNLKRTLSCSLWLLASFLLGGCEHLYYADPNPEKPYAFPSQPAGASMAPAPSTPSAPALTTVSPVSSSYYAPGNIAAMPATPLPEAKGGNPVANAGNASILQKGDMVTISFTDIPPPGMPEFRQRIPDDGKLSLPLLDTSVQAAGKTGYQLEQELKGLYVPRYFVRLTVSVKSDERWYYVGGEVRTANRYPFSGEITVLRAIDTAGGFGDFANRKKIELRRANGQVHMLNQNDVLKNPQKDLPVFPNDQIIVHKRFF